ISHTCGDPWAILMLPWACVIDEPVRVEAPVDRLLLENLRGLQQIWRSWYPELAIVPIEAPARAPGLPRDGAPPGSRTAAFFSGGIDSLFTLLRHGETLTGSGSSTVDDLLYVAGFNTSLDDFDAARAALAPVADAFRKTLVPIATNI